jgi:rubrerythrin
MVSEETKKILSNAITGEESTFKFYNNISKEIRHFNCRMLFEKLALEEMKHEEFLKEYLDKTNYFTRRKMEALGEIDLTPNYKMTQGFNPTFDTKGLKQAFRLAFESESKAIQDYMNAALKLPDGDTKFVIQKLADLEQAHLDILKDEYSKLFSVNL